MRCKSGRSTVPVAICPAQIRVAWNKSLAFYIGLNIERLAFKAEHGNDPLQGTSVRKTQRSFA